jgi:hypothetical protein
VFEDVKLLWVFQDVWRIVIRVREDPIHNKRDKLNKQKDSGWPAVADFGKT